MATSQVLLHDKHSILNSLLIQIAHIHPDDCYRVRTDLEQERLVVESYPIVLANKIVPFLNQPPSASRRASTSSTKRRSSQSPSKNGTLTPPRSRASTSVSSEDDTPLASLSAQRKRRSPASLPNPTTTPARPVLLPPDMLGTGVTSRTMSPNGRLYSPVKDIDQTPSRICFAAPQDLSSIPSRAFSPPEPCSPLLPAKRSHVQGRGRGREGRRGRGGGTYQSRRPPPKIAEYDPSPRQVECSWAKPTLTLRHDLSLQALRDVFAWSLKCVQIGAIVGLEEILVSGFHDTTRLEDVETAASVLKLGRLKTECKRLLEKWAAPSRSVDGNQKSTASVECDGMNDVAIWLDTTEKETSASSSFSYGRKIDMTHHQVWIGVG